jgi:hypothetical protein
MENEKKIPSPCDKCPKNSYCYANLSKCYTWEIWFREYWKGLRHMCGVDKGVKKNGKRSP